MKNREAKSIKMLASPRIWIVNATIRQYIPKANIFSFFLTFFNIASSLLFFNFHNFWISPKYYLKGDIKKVGYIDYIV
jgi:hypothetical protein